MTRPRKQGLDYFTHDTDAMSDDKIEILRALHGNNGYVFYFGMLERIYREPDFEYKVSDAEIIQILSKKFLITPDEFKLILASAFKYGCFDAELYEKTGKLSSAGIKKRAYIVVKKRLSMRDRYASEVSDAETREETGEEMPQSKVKESKVKESNGILVPDGTRIPEDSSDEESPRQPPAPYQEILKLYHQNCHSFAKLFSLSKSRMKKIHTRWLEHPDVKQWQEAFSKIEASSFCKGNNRNNWKASLDWLVDNDKNMLKVLEGNYDDKTEAKEVIIPVNTSILKMRG